MSVDRLFKALLCLVDGRWNNTIVFVDVVLNLGVLLFDLHSYAAGKLSPWYVP